MECSGSPKPTPTVSPGTICCTTCRRGRRLSASKSPALPARSPTSGKCYGRSWTSCAPAPGRPAGSAPTQYHAAPSAYAYPPPWNGPAAPYYAANPAPTPSIPHEPPPQAPVVQAAQPVPTPAPVPAPVAVAEPAPQPANPKPTGTVAGPNIGGPSGSAAHQRHRAVYPSEQILIIKNYPPRPLPNRLRNPHPETPPGCGVRPSNPQGRGPELARHSPNGGTPNAPGVPATPRWRPPTRHGPNIRASSRR